MWRRVHRQRRGLMPSCWFSYCDNQFSFNWNYRNLKSSFHDSQSAPRALSHRKKRGQGGAIMLSQTLVDGLEQYRIGPKLRRLRLKKSMGLVQLGEHTGLSPALLSKIERGQIFPTLPTLLR